MPKVTIDDTQIAEAAFYLWLEEGQPEGRDQEHWRNARETLEAAIAKPKKRAAKPRAAAKTARPKTPRKAPAKKTSVN